MKAERICKWCETPLVGRVDKMFCDEGCRSAFHYERNKGEHHGLYLQIKKQLALNRRILKKYNAGGKSTVREALLLDDGFNPSYFTHYWKNRKGDVYLFCFEYGFLRRKEKGKNKFVLVQWQDYMKASN